MNTTSPFLATSPVTDRAPRYWNEITVSIGDRKTDILLVCDGDALLHVWFGPLHPGDGVPSDWIQDARPLRQAASQLEAYAEGDLEGIRPAHPAERNGLPARGLACAHDDPIWNDNHLRTDCH